MINLVFQHKKIINITLFLFLFSFLYNSHAINITNSPNYETNCPWAVSNNEIYIDSNQKTIYPEDLMKSNKLLFVRAWETEVSIWQNWNWILSNECFTPWNWSYWWARTSNVVPSFNNWVSVVAYFWNNCKVNKVPRSDWTKPSIQFVYKIAYKEEQWYWNWNSSYFYYPFENWWTSPNYSSLSDQTARVWWNINVHPNECDNFTFAWCWDGVKQSNETCDPNDPNKVGWGSKICTSQCTLPTDWWWWQSCISWWINWSQSSPISAWTSWLCRSWETLWNFSSTTSWNTTYYTWSCDWNTWWNCSASYTSSWGWGWWWGWGWGWWGWSSNYCWDWILQRPNDNGEFEECDFWNGTWPAWCQRTTCDIIENTQPWSNNPLNNTIPNWWTISIYPNNDLLIWHWMSVFWNLSSSLAYIQNNSPSDIYIDKKLCVYKDNVSYNVVNWISNICTANEIWFLSKNGWKKWLNVSDSTFIWTVSNLPNWVDYWDANIVTTLDWLSSINTFLKSTLKVRVAKPSVTTIWWWASLLNWTNFSDINNLSSWIVSLNPNVNKNLILTSMWISPLSSYVKKTSDNNVVLESKEEWNKDLNNFSIFSTSLWISSINHLPTSSYNWFNNVFIHKWDVVLNSQNITWWNKTYVIEDWNLIINGNINSSDSILFVVKNWDIIINKLVTEIDAIIINIWWEIKGDWGYTLDRLVINWALYGNVGDLLSRRTYIKDRGAYIDVWTVVNFTSKIFSSPPPLLSKFLWEYSNSEKIPR